LQREQTRNLETAATQPAPGTGGREGAAHVLFVANVGRHCHGARPRRIVAAPCVPASALLPSPRRAPLHHDLGTNTRTRITRVIGAIHRRTTLPSRFHERTNGRMDGRARTDRRTGEHGGSVLPAASRGTHQNAPVTQWTRGLGLAPKRRLENSTAFDHWGASSEGLGSPEFVAAGWPIIQGSLFN
jgi:hypothetical protein